MHGTGRTLNNLALLWAHQNLISKALPYALEALKILENTQDLEELQKARQITALIEAALNDHNTSPTKED